jgi:hypothetical protein
MKSSFSVRSLSIRAGVPLRSLLRPNLIASAVDHNNEVHALTAARSFAGGYAAMTVMRAALMSDERRLRPAVLPPFAICVVQERQRCRQLRSAPRGGVRRACDSLLTNCVEDRSGEIKRCCPRSLLSYISMLGLSNHNDRPSIAPCMVMESLQISLKLTKERIP